MPASEFEERVAQLVTHAKKDPEWTCDLMPNLSQKLRERTMLLKNDPDCRTRRRLATTSNRSRLSDMIDVAIPWKGVYATYTELDNMPDSVDWTREDIMMMMLKHVRVPMKGALMLVRVPASSGVRCGALDLNGRHN